MARRRYPPLPSGVRPLFWVLKALGVLVGLGALYVGVFAASRGSWSTTFIALIMGGGFATLTWMNPSSTWFAPTLTGLGLLAAVYLRSWPLAVMLAGTAGLFVLLRKQRVGGRGARVDPDKIVIDAPDAVMKNAQAFVSEFETAGFEQVGALRINIGPFKVIESLLLSPDGLSYAAVTDAIVHVTSLFPDGRGLVTRNSDRAVLPDYLLVDSVAGGAPNELIASHAAALALVAERDHFPIPIAAPELPQIAIDGERAAIAFASTDRHSKQGSDGKGPLWSRPGRYEQIDSWHGAGQV